MSGSSSASRRCFILWKETRQSHFVIIWTTFDILVSPLNFYWCSLLANGLWIWQPKHSHCCSTYSQSAFLPRLFIKMEWEVEYKGDQRPLQEQRVTCPEGNVQLFIADLCCFGTYAPFKSKISVE
ncbi:hypothetical protein J437_LFUL009804 [Ladona fulva]|uniref:Uncharacterized protein n=1 Tax=Ladona fulva TaxID=123851 RepID=A0A8K0JZ70_LADFU|nr:hypothetical protein J437_LFUL009804 [Ladona fulva]